MFQCHSWSPSKWQACRLRQARPTIESMRGRSKHATLSHDFLLDCLDRRLTDDTASRVSDGRHSYVGRFQARLAYVRVAMEARRSDSEIRTEATRGRFGYARFLAS